MKKGSEKYFEKIEPLQKSTPKHHLICQSFEEFKFEEFKKEKNSLIWKNYNDNGNRQLQVTKGDIIYIFCTNLPDSISRILIKCKVEEVDVWENEEHGFKLKFEKAIKPFLKDERPFSYNDLITKYGISNVQGKQHLYIEQTFENNSDHSRGKFQKDLVDDLEKYFNDKEKSATMSELCNDFNGNLTCKFYNVNEIKNTNGNKASHVTFKRENGTVYYVYHHFIQQYNGRKTGNEKISDDIINDLDNIITLCPTCHDRIHHGNISDKKFMVTYIYNDNKKKYDELLSRYTNATGIKIDNNLDWLLEQYNVKKEEEKSKKL